ncbi:MAG: PqqD family protein [Candidatus Marinimicrobia bacterium]|nr:PqqD family protein [Candidatus Neomarinimicrobiota bacterium]
MNYQKQDKPKTRENLLFKELEDGGVVYEPAMEKCHSLNASSAYIWSLCDGNFSVEEIINTIKKDFKKFDIDPEKAVVQILQKFEELKLLEK